MSRNLGQTKLRKRRYSKNAMREYDKLPAVLRAWLAQAALPWRPQSVRNAYDRTIAQTGDPSRALAVLDQLQERQLAKDRSLGQP